MVHEYIAIPVDTQTYDNTNIGEEFAGLTVVDGLYDSDDDQLILVLRVNNPSENSTDKPLSCGAKSVEGKIKC